MALALPIVLVVVACGANQPSANTGTPAGSNPAGAPGTGSVKTVALGSLDDPMNATAPRAGAKRMHFEFGPITVKPGQNKIDNSNFKIAKPTEDGWITRISPNIRRADGTVPPVDVIHLHHGVWVNVSAKDATFPQFPERFMAAGEEKTIAELPEGYGYPYKTTDKWVINYMLHNLFPTTEQIWITYDLDVIPATAPEAAAVKAARPVWLDVQNGSGYPVFDAVRGAVPGDTYTYPDQATDPYPLTPTKPLNEWVVDRDGVLLGGGVHLHPGGLYGDIFLARNGASAAPASGVASAVKADEAHLFRSEYQYYEPAGAVSWDVSSKVTPPEWRVAIKKGDRLRLNVTYDMTRGSWYESMGIFVLWMADTGTGADPFATKVNAPGVITHGHLAENDSHGGAPATLPDATKLPDGSLTSRVDIKDFSYGEGDTSEQATSVPVVHQGGTITFDNSYDAPRDNGIWHTITACKAPCNETTGIAFPLANGVVQFDSGELGLGGAPTAGRNTWDVPKTLDTGTYTYFCRIHPFMRGAFRVTPPSG